MINFAGGFVTGAILGIGYMCLLFIAKKGETEAEADSLYPRHAKGEE